METVSIAMALPAPEFSNQIFTTNGLEPLPVLNEGQTPTVVEVAKPRQRRTRARTRRNQESIEEYRSIAYLRTEISSLDSIRTFIESDGYWRINFVTRKANVILHGHIHTDIEGCLHKINILIAETTKLRSAIEAYLEDGPATVTIVDSSPTVDIELPFQIAPRKTFLPAKFLAALNKYRRRPISEQVDNIVNDIKKEGTVWEVRHSIPDAVKEETFKAYRSTSFLNHWAMFRNVITTFLDTDGEWGLYIEDCDSNVLFDGFLVEDFSDTLDEDPTIYLLTTIINEITKLRDAIQERYLFPPKKS